MKFWPKRTRLVLNLSADVRVKAEERAHAAGISLTAWAERLITDDVTKTPADRAFALLDALDDRIL